MTFFLDSIHASQPTIESICCLFFSSLFGKTKRALILSVRQHNTYYIYFLSSRPPTKKEEKEKPIEEAVCSAINPIRSDDFRALAEAEECSIGRGEEEN